MRPAGHTSADIDFHSLIVRETGSDRLSRMHELILGEVHMTMGLFSAYQAAPANSITEHAAIIEAMVSEVLHLGAMRRL